MLNLWKVSTSVLVVHLVLVFVAFLFLRLDLDGHDSSSIIGVVINVIGLLSFFFVPGAFAATIMAASSAFISVLLVGEGELGISLIAAGSVLIAFVFVSIAAYEARKGGVPEPFWACAIAASPFGIGTVLGGALYFFMFREPLTRRPDSCHNTTFRSDVRGNEGLPPDEP